MLHEKKKKQQQQNMRGNWSVYLDTGDILLVPYCQHYVATYHEWMKDEWIQEMTASEPLSMEEEYEMQKSWLEDPKKCTFIILAKKECQNKKNNVYPDFSASAMVGDVNLFLNDYENPRRAEIEIMVAAPEWRRRGVATQALRAMMAYGHQFLNLDVFYCKISDKNQASLNLFDRLGFIQCNYSEAFKEVELEFFFTLTDEDSSSVIQKQQQDGNTVQPEVEVDGINETEESKEVEGQEEYELELGRAATNSPSSLLLLGGMVNGFSTATIVEFPHDLIQELFGPEEHLDTAS
mmetsp:Transcript_16836/g.29720  ORF Transcript_16836/g.29720 Transcript_16836/m.29720 type:complete len:293 (-) Transcript_16836:101-979(-)